MYLYCLLVCVCVCVCVCVSYLSLSLSLSIYIYIYIYYKQLITINRIQNKGFCFHNICVFTCVWMYHDSNYECFLSVGSNSVDEQGNKVSMNFHKVMF